MRAALTGFCIGVMVFAIPWPDIPSCGVVGVSGTAAITLTFGTLIFSVARGRAAGTLRWSGVWIAAGMLLGFAWSGCQHRAALELRLPSTAVQDFAALEILVVSEPVELSGAPGRPSGIRFQARIQDGGVQVAERLQGRTVRLSWYAAPDVALGETWRIAVALRGPWSYANPAGFDFERWLLAQRIHGTGQVRRGERVAAATPRLPVRARAALVDFLETASEAHRGIYGALLIGRTVDIDAALWEVFRRTGTIHLMVISGLHISLAAGLGYLVGRAAVRVVPGILLWLDARKAGALLGLVAAAGYVLLSGAGLASLRALLMAIPVLLLVAWGRRALHTAPLLMACAVLLAADPLSIHQHGFWLSFGAVAILVVGFAGRHGPSGPVAELLRVQWLLLLALSPVLLLLTGQFASTSLPANLLAVPVVSFVVMPLIFLAALLSGLWPSAASMLITLADWVLWPLLRYLEWLAELPELHLDDRPSGLLLALAAAVALLLGAPARYRLPCLLCLSVPLLPPAARIPEGHFRVMALDVGQGEAVSVDTARHRLLFDTGPGFPGGFEVGSAVVVPTLRATGPGRLDVLVLSHPDIDHVGGAAAVRAALPIARILASFDEPGAESCDGRRWRWDGVDFELLDLPRPLGAGSNDQSCVLLIGNGSHQVVLAGDIGATIEQGLMRRVHPPVHLLFAPHHGSRTSSSTALVRVLQPELVFISAGWLNRFGHPHPDVVRRYRDGGARLYQTGRTGALIWQSTAPDAVLAWRRDRARYWWADAAEPIE